MQQYASKRLENNKGIPQPSKTSSSSSPVFLTMVKGRVPSSWSSPRKDCSVAELMLISLNGNLAFLRTLLTLGFIGLLLSSTQLSKQKLSDEFDCQKSH